jgi:hypothetical protein
MPSSRQNIKTCARLTVLISIIPFTAQFFSQVSIGNSLYSSRFGKICSATKKIGVSQWPVLQQPKRPNQRAAINLLNMMLIEDEDEKDFREADLTGKRLFVTGLASTVDDVRLYLAFEPVGSLQEAHVVKPG